VGLVRRAGRHKKYLLESIMPRGAHCDSMAQISGRVVERGSDTPIPGANVFAGLDGMQEPPKEPMPSATSDAEGRFRLSGLAGGRYHVGAHKMGYAPSAEMSLVRLVDVGQDDSLENIVVELARGGSVAGHVLDPSGRAMEGVQVMALLKRLKTPPASTFKGPAADGPPVLMPMGGGTTTRAGEFEITGLPPGEYLVAVPRPEEQRRGDRRVSSPDVLVLTYYPSAQEPAAARVIDVEDQKIGDVAISLVAVPGFRVSGTIVDSAGGPVPNAGVMMKLKTGSDQLLDLMADPFRMENADETGRFNIEGVTPGTYELTVMTGGSGGFGVALHDSYYAIAYRDGVPHSVPLPDEFAEPPEPGAVVVTVIASDVTNVTLTTAPGGR
jgi:Carboxypeptidase regulatory-like domain